MKLQNFLYVYQEHKQQDNNWRDQFLKQGAWKETLKAYDYQTPLNLLNQLVKHLRIIGHHHATPLSELIEKVLEDFEELVDQFLCIKTSLGNWSYVLRALELKVKLAGKEKGELNYEEMLSSLELVVWVRSAQNISSNH